MEREDFFLQLLVDYILLNEIVAGPLTEQCLDKVGIKHGLGIEDAYRASHNIKGKLTAEQFADLAVGFLNALGGEYVLRIVDDEKVALTSYSCPFGHIVLKTSGLCQLYTAIFGGIAARNFPYSKVSIENSIAKKSTSCQLVFYLTATEQAEQANGTVFRNDPTSYMMTRHEIQIISEEMLANNFVYKKYVESMENLQSMHRELESEYNQLRNEIFSDLKLGVLTINEEEKISYMNKTAQELLSVENYWDTPITRDFQLLLKETLTTGTRFNQQLSKMSFEDGPRYYSFNTAPLDDEDGKIVGVVSVFQDMTERKMMEDELLQMEKLALLAELAAGTAHEIRNPMTTLRGFLQILAKEFSKDMKGYEYCSLMIDEIDRVNGIIKEFLLLTKPAAPKLKEADLHVILEEIFLLIESKSLLENVELHKKYTRRLPLVKVDPAQIKQVFLNLASNAIQAMPVGGHLTISTLNGDGKAIVEFTDTGCGMDEAQLKKIFNPFFTTKETGTGLGLTISYRIIENHGGKITVNSIPTKGTTFAVELPVISGDIEEV